jgi:hypothetical protein
MLGRKPVFGADHFHAACGGDPFGERTFDFRAAQAIAAAMEVQHMATGQSFGNEPQSPPSAQRGFHRRPRSGPHACREARHHLRATLGKIGRGGVAGAFGRNDHCAACTAIDRSRLPAVRLAPIAFNSGIT